MGWGRNKKVHLEHNHTFSSLYNRFLFSVTFVHDSFSRKVCTISTQCLLGDMSTHKSDVAVIVHGVKVCFGWKFVLKDCTKCNRGERGGGERERERRRKRREREERGRGGRQREREEEEREGRERGKDRERERERRRRRRRSRIEKGGGGRQSANLSTEQTTTANKHKQLKHNACFNEAISLSFQMVDFWTNRGLKVNQVNQMKAK